MSVAFPSLDRRLSRVIHELHNYLWQPGWTGNEGELRAGLLKGAKDLDGFLGARGRLRKHVEALTNPWSREHQGASLFELLTDTLGLTAAAELLSNGKYRDAALRAQAVVESTSIGLCSASGNFEVVQDWEGRKIGFETYARRLAAALQAKFIPGTEQFARVLIAVHEFGADWDGSASKEEQALAARASIDSAAWIVRRATGIRALVGASLKVPEKEFEAFLTLIVRRL